MTLGVSVTQTELEAVRKLAAAEDRSVSNFLRQALRTVLTDTENGANIGSADTT